MDPVVRVVDGRFGYRGRVIVEADLDVVRGEVVALVGANGSGKSTLVKGILGLAERLGGTVELFGVPAGRLREIGVGSATCPSASTPPDRSRPR